jgi:hypothetical protein
MKRPRQQKRHPRQQKISKNNPAQSPKNPQKPKNRTDNPPKYFAFQQEITGNNEQNVERNFLTFMQKYGNLCLRAAACDQAVAWGRRVLPIIEQNCRSLCKDSCFYRCAWKTSAAREHHRTLPRKGFEPVWKPGKKARSRVYVCAGLIPVRSYRCGSSYDKKSVTARKKSP